MYIYIVIVATLQIYTFLTLTDVSNFGDWCVNLTHYVLTFSIFII